MATGLLSMVSRGVSTLTFLWTGLMHQTPSKPDLLSIIDDLVVRLEEEGYPFIEVLEALIEYSEVCKDIYFSPKALNIYEP